MASFMNPGQTLSNLCVAVGPRDAASIRHEYLLDNDGYVVRSLESLRDLPYHTLYFNYFSDKVPMLNKCRDDIVAWMAVNKGWRSCCTFENMEKCMDSPQRIDHQYQGIGANLPFNNPAVAIEITEIGLVEVLCFLVEVKNIDVNGSLWRGFVSDHMYPDLKFCLLRDTPWSVET